jgi:hypothetical protein
MARTKRVGRRLPRSKTQEVKVKEIVIPKGTDENGEPITARVSCVVIDGGASEDRPVEKRKRDEENSESCPNRKTPRLTWVPEERVVTLVHSSKNLYDAVYSVESDRNQILELVLEWLRLGGQRLAVMDGGPVLEFYTNSTDYDRADYVVSWFAQYKRRRERFDKLTQTFYQTTDIVETVLSSFLADEGLLDKPLRYSFSYEQEEYADYFRNIRSDPYIHID